MDTPIYITPDQAKIWIMAQFLASVGAFDIKNGQVIINFNSEGVISSVKTIHNHVPPRMGTNLTEKW